MKGSIDTAEVEDFKYKNADFKKKNTHSSGYIFIGMLFDVLQKLGIVALYNKRRGVYVTKNSIFKKPNVKP